MQCDAKMLYILGMAVELVLWFVGSAVFLLFLLFVVRPYVLSEHDDEPEHPAEADTASGEDDPSRSVDPPP